MAKSQIRLKIRKLRKENGLSIIELAKRFGVAKSSVSLWCRDIELSPEQVDRLVQNTRSAGVKGRLLGAQVQKERRLKLIESLNSEALTNLKDVTIREKLMLGLGVYWGEGFKKWRKAGISNSDPLVITFMISWFKEVFNLTNDDITCQVGINYIHKERDEEVRKFWSNLTGIPLTNFTKTSFKIVNNKKVYENFNEHYGTLSVNVRQPARIYYRIMGLLNALGSIY